MSIDPRLEEQVRQGFKYLNRFMLLLWRLGLGPALNIWPAGLGRYLVITHLGRKSGLKRRTPVNYSDIDGEIYCTAGFGSASDWYRNLKATPHSEVWLPTGWWQGEAEEVTEPEARLRILRQVIIDSGFAGRLFGLDPYTMPDVDFDAATKDYRVMHLRRTAERTGPDGPGDLAWVWLVLVLLLLPLAWRPRSRRCGCRQRKCGD